MAIAAGLGPVLRTRARSTDGPFVSAVSLMK